MNKIKIPWAKPIIGQDELSQIIDSFNNNWLSMGPKVKEFEVKMSKYLNVPYGIAVSNGSMALDIVLKSIDIGPGDEIIVPALTYFATAASVSYQGASPVFVDIDEYTFNLNPDLIPDAISDKTKAIIYIDYGGNPADYNALSKISEKYNVQLIHDAAQSLGTLYDQKYSASLASISTMSFHMAKIMTTIEGGMIFTHNQNIANDVMCRRNQGEPKNGKYQHIVLGTNARMTDMQAGIGIEQLNKLPTFLDERNKIALKYNKLFDENGIRHMKTANKGNTNSYFFYPILLNNRDLVSEELRKKYGIDTRIAYPMPLYKQELYSSGLEKSRHLNCPVTEEVTSKILNLPIYPFMLDEDIQYVVDSIREIIY